MKFDRLALLDAVDKAIAAHRAAHDRKVEQWEETVRRSKEQWLQNHGGSWLTAIQRIEEKLQAGDVVESNDYPSQTWHEPYHNGQKPGTYPEPLALRALRTSLAAVADETITVSGLRSLGVTSSTLQSAISYLAPPEVPARAS